MTEEDMDKLIVETIDDLAPLGGTLYESVLKRAVLRRSEGAMRRADIDARLALLDESGVLEWRFENTGRGSKKWVVRLLQVPA